NRAAYVYIKATQEFLGVIGEFKPSVRANLKLPQYCAGFELDTSVLAKLINEPAHFVPLSQYPRINQDITLSLPDSVSYQEATDLISSSIQQIKPKNSHASLSPLDIFQKDEKQKNITWRLSLVSYDRTLTDNEVSNLLDKATSSLSKLGAKRQ